MKYNIHDNPSNIKNISDVNDMKKLLINDCSLIKFLDVKKARCYYDILLEENGENIQYIQENDEIFLTNNHWGNAILKSPNAFKFFKNKHLHKDLCEFVCTTIGTNIKYISDDDNFTNEEKEYYIKLAINSDPRSIYFVKNNKRKYCQMALDKSKDTLMYMINDIKKPYIESSHNNDSCAICLSDHKDDCNKKWCKLSCNHILHKGCVDNLLCNNIIKCPLCRSEFPIEFLT